MYDTLDLELSIMERLVPWDGRSPRHLAVISPPEREWYERFLLRSLCFPSAPLSGRTQDGVHPISMPKAGGLPGLMRSLCYSFTCEHVSNWLTSADALWQAVALLKEHHVHTLLISRMDNAFRDVSPPVTQVDALLRFARAANLTLILSGGAMLDAAIHKHGELAGRIKVVRNVQTRPARDADLPQVDLQELADRKDAG